MDGYIQTVIYRHRDMDDTDTRPCLLMDIVQSKEMRGSCVLNSPKTIIHKAMSAGLSCGLCSTLFTSQFKQSSTPIIHFDNDSFCHNPSKRMIDTNTVQWKMYAQTYNGLLKVVDDGWKLIILNQRGSCHPISFLFFLRFFYGVNLLLLVIPF